MAGQTKFTRLHIRRQNLEESVNDCGILWEPTKWRVREWICFGLAPKVRLDVATSPSQLYKY